MTCTNCGGELAPGSARCPLCNTARVPRVEGALAADPKLVTPPARRNPRLDANGFPVREAGAAGAAGERSWRDEVQERVRSRQKKRADSGLPLFEQPALDAIPDSAAPSTAAQRPPRAVPAVPVAPAEGSIEARVRERVARSTRAATDAPQVSVDPAPAPAVAPALRRMAAPRAPAPQREPSEMVAPGLTEAELADLPLRTLVPRPTTPDVVDRDFLDAPPPIAPVSAAPAADPDVFLPSAGLEQQLELEPPPSDPEPLERPARGFERAQAAAFDLALFTAIGAVALYFTGRAARVALPALVPSWPWLLAFLGLLAVFYACYFTGTTGQTPGKLLLGLRVVDTNGRPPSYARAVGRALAGLAGLGLAGVGQLPMMFDPAGRALHDRLFGTRVVRR